VPERLTVVPMTLREAQDVTLEVIELEEDGEP
jgi:hypothetical protein